MSPVFRGLRSAAQSMAPMNRAVPAGIERYMLPTERSAISVRQHPAVLIGPALLALAGLAAAVVLADMVPRDKQELVLAVWIAWLILLVRFVARIFGWVNALLVISSVRMLLVTGQFSRTVSIIPFASFTDMSVQRSFSGRLLGYGNLIVEYGGLDQKMQKIEYLPYAEEFYMMVSEAIFSYINRDQDVGRVSCPVCNGEGRIFRRASKSFTASGQAGEDPSVDDSPRTREDLMAQGYVEAVCSECDGEGTIPSKSS